MASRGGAVRTTVREIREMYEALGLPLLAGAETVTEPSIEVIVPERLRGLLAEPVSAPASDPDRLPTTIEGAHVGDETATPPPSPTPPAPASPAPPVPAPSAPETPAAAAPAPPIPDPRAQRLAVEAARDLDRVEDEVELARTLRAKMPATTASVVALTPEEEMLPEAEWERLRVQAVEEAKGAEDFGDAINAAFGRLREADKLRATKRAELLVSKRAAAEKQGQVDLRNAELRALEASARERYTDFDRVMDASGMWTQAHPDAQGHSPAIVKIVYGAVDPATKAYWLGRAQLARKSGAAIDAPIERLLQTAAAPSAPAPPVVPSAPAAPVVPAAPVPAASAPAPRDAAQIRRETQAETVQRLESTSGRPQGLDTLTPAGQPTSRFTLEQLDRLQRENPDAYYALVQANPALDYFHMSGGGTDTR